MARYDKYDPISGGFRAPLAAAVTSDDVGKPLAVGLDANGRVVVGAGNSGVLGVYVADEPKAAGDVADCMTAGEIVEVASLAAGTAYYGASADGAVSTTNTGTYLGHTVEATRLVVRVSH
jgi:hypothetical protein